MSSFGKIRWTPSVWKEFLNLSREVIDSFFLCFGCGDFMFGGTRSVIFPVINELGNTFSMHHDRRVFYASVNKVFFCLTKEK